MLAACATCLLLVWNLLHDQLLGSVVASIVCFVTAGVLGRQAVRLAWSRPGTQATSAR